MSETVFDALIVGSGASGMFAAKELTAQGLNVVLLACYTWGCHVLRHVVGGRMDEVSKSPTCDFAYACVSSLNGRHQLFAWCSLFSVMSSDLYVRLCSMGVITDLRSL